jgi:putative ABC transport system permease protein
MTLGENSLMAFHAIWTHKMRSFLTLLGVIIGVTTIIAMMTVITGIQKMMEKEMSELTTNVFQLQRYEPHVGIHIDGDWWRRQRRPNITLENAKAIRERCPSVTNVGPEAWQWAVQVAYEGEKTNPNVSLSGGTPEFMYNNGMFVREGRFITDIDVEYNRAVVVLGQDIINKLFPYENPLEKRVRVDGRPYEVIGVFEERGSSFGHSRDNVATIPVTTFQKQYGKNRSLNITIQAVSAEKMDQAMEEVRTVMRIERGLKSYEPDNFAMFSSNTLIESFNKFTFWIKIAAVGICGVSLLVAGIGIMNIMLVSVRERTREIGVRKALGAKRRHIMVQFLIEAVVLTEIGGAIGIVVGIVLPIALGSAYKIPTAVPIWACVLGIVFCSVVGITFGLWPAMKAARLDPIVALRYE